MFNRASSFFNRGKNIIGTAMYGMAAKNVMTDVYNNLRSGDMCPGTDSIVDCIKMTANQAAVVILAMYVTGHAAYSLLSWAGKQLDNAENYIAEKIVDSVIPRFN
jgi:hypothetical protein